LVLPVPAMKARRLVSLVEDRDRGAPPCAASLPTRRAERERRYEPRHDDAPRRQRDPHESAPPAKAPRRRALHRPLVPHRPRDGHDGPE
jgi:hypothetical protein